MIVEGAEPERSTPPPPLEIVFHDDEYSNEVTVLKRRQNEIENMMKEEMERQVAHDKAVDERL